MNKNKELENEPDDLKKLLADKLSYIKILEEELELKNREIKIKDRLHSGIQKMLTCGSGSFAEVLKKALQELLRFTKSKFGFLYLYNEMTRHFLYKTWGRDYELQDCLVEVDDTSSLENIGWWGKVIKEKSPILKNELSEQGLPFNREGEIVNRLLVIPLKMSEKVYFVAGVANRSTDYDTNDLKYLTLLAAATKKNLERLELIDQQEKIKQKAANIDNLKSAFLQNISHEIRTPLNAIMGFSKLINKPGISDETRNSYASIIINNSNQLLSVVTDILTISSLDSKQLNLELAEVNIYDLLRNLEIVFKKQKLNTNVSVRLNWQMEEKDVVLLTDKTKLTQILTNLLNNAIKFSDKGAVEFGCKTSGRLMEFYVKDEGIGIPDSQIDKVFERFYQVDMTRSRDYGGTGLGLSICKEFISILQGEIWVESAPQKGSTFHFSIPFIPVFNQKKEIEKAGLPIGNLKILVAEDEASNFKLIKELLAPFDCTFLHAEDGIEVIHLIKENQDIDLILMDIKMPKLEGHLAAKRIKVMHPKIPIIAQTAYALPGEIAKYGYIFDDYISKPVDGEVLLKTIYKFVNAEAKDKLNIN